MKLTFFSISAVTALTLASASAFAAPSAPLTLSNDSASFSPGTNGGTYNGSSNTVGIYDTYSQEVDSSFTTGQHSVTVIAPTSTAVGLAYDYSDYINTYRIADTTNYTNNISMSASVNPMPPSPVNYSGDKYIVLTGTLTNSSNAAQYLNLNLSASGNFIATTGFNGITVAPALPNFYFGTGASLNSIILASENNGSFVTSANSLSYSSQSYSSLSLASGGAQSFEAVVDAGNGVSLSSFTLGLNTGVFATDITYSPFQTSTISTLVGSHILPAVPEPGEYMLMLMGFGLTGMFAVRRKKSA